MLVDLGMPADIALMFLFAGALMSAAWLFREQDQREIERYKQLINERTVDLRCRQCNGRFEPWVGGFVPIRKFTPDGNPLGRTIQITCRDCHSHVVVYENGGTLFTASVAEGQGSEKQLCAPHE